jgi:hypothetical protein
MDSRDNSDIPIKIISILSVSLCFCCLLLCCAGYILSKKKNKKQTQIHLTNDRHHSLAHTDIFTIDVHDVQLPYITNLDPAYLYASENPPVLHQPIEEPLSS